MQVIVTQVIITQVIITQVIITQAIIYASKASTVRNNFSTPSTN